MDFLDRVTLADPPAITSRIQCDSLDCGRYITVQRDITEQESVVIAIDHGWDAHAGMHRAYHWCERCR